MHEGRLSLPPAYADDPSAAGDAHLVQFYDVATALVDAVDNLIGNGLVSGASAIVIATAGHLGSIEQRLADRGIDLARARAAGAYVALDAQQALDALLLEGQPDAGRFGNTIAPLVAAAARRAPRVVIFGEMVALLWNAGNHEAAVRLEALWNELAREHAFTLLCGYPIAQMGSAPWHAVHAVCAAHEHTLPARGAAPSSEAKRLAEICDLAGRARALSHAIGQRNAVERRLASRERELSDVLSNAAEAIHSVGPDGTILWANRFELDMLGYAADEYVGHRIGEFYADEAVAARILDRLHDGPMLHDEPARMRCKDGSIRDVLVTSNVFRDDDGFSHTRCFTRDVSERARAERALRASEERAAHMRSLLAAIVESSDDAIVSKSLDGRITSWNEGARRLFGYTAQEAVGRRITMIIPAEHEHEEHEILAKLARGERIEHFETVRIAKDGRQVHVSLTISPVCDAHGKVIGASKVARDVSERRRMEEKLREADRHKDEFIAVLGHELRNPLAPIRNIAEVLRRTATGTPGVERLCSILERQVAQMTRLLDDLLDVSRITRGRIKFQREPVDLVEVVQRAVEASRPLIERHGHELRLQLPKAGACVRGDAARLVQMATNLLNNAAKYTPEHGRIGLRVAQRRRSFELRIRDNGIGIAPDALDSIFELFVQRDRTGSRAPEGLGIGLTLVRIIAEYHGGSVKAKSGGHGRGSEFVVTLPAAVEALPAAEVRTQDAPGHAGQKRILILDDNRDSSESLAALLRLHGHDVFVAADGASGVRMVEALGPDLALLDIGLPGMDGYEVARRLRAHGCSVPLAALTGYGTPEDRERARHAGFDHHFVKPIDPVALERLIGSLA